MCIRDRLIGNHQTGKTSIAFNLAYSIALQGGKPLYICNQIKLESKIPLTLIDSNQEFMDDNTTPNDAHHISHHISRRGTMLSEVLQRINMKYITNINDLKVLISGLHLFEPKPTVVIIDDMSMLIDPLLAINRSDGKFLEIVLRLTSYLQDAIQFLSTSQLTVPTIIDTNTIDNEHNAIIHSTDQDKNNTRRCHLDPTANTVHRLKAIITDSCKDKMYLQLLSRVMTNILSLQSMDDHSINTNNNINNTIISTNINTATTHSASISNSSRILSTVPTVTLSILTASDYHLCDNTMTTTCSSNILQRSSATSPSSSSTLSRRNNLSIQLYNNALYIV